MALILTKIRRKFSQNQYIFSQHVDDKLESLNLKPKDIEAVLKNGEVVETQANDERGDRYVIIGYATDDIELEVVCRFTLDEKVLFITCYDLY
jgi:uncharacterized DUF497 family protein